MSQNDKSEIKSQNGVPESPDSTKFSIDTLIKELECCLNDPGMNLEGYLKAYTEMSK